MQFYLEKEPNELTIVIGWHSWDLSDCVMPNFADADEDIEDDWRTMLLHVNTAEQLEQCKEIEPELSAFVVALNGWCFEGFFNPPESDDLTNTSWALQLNKMMEDAYFEGKLLEAVPELTAFMQAHHNDHWREHPALRQNLK